MKLTATFRTASNKVTSTLSAIALCLLVLAGMLASPAISLGMQDDVDGTSEGSPQNIEADDTKDPYAINRVPEQAKDIGVEDKIGDFIDPDSPFHDHDNRFVHLGDYFDGEQPVMLSFNYSNCPKLCSVQLENMVQALARIKFRVGTDFKMVSISIDPLEQASRARQSKDKYAFMYNKGESVDGFHFLTGKKEEIKYVADTCGFQYKYVKEQKLFSHPPVFILISPNGKIVRYIHGLDYDPDTIEKALIEAAEGKIGSSINQISYGLGCFVFDEASGKYNFQAMAAMRIGALLTIGGLMITLVPYWFFNRNKKTDNGNSGDNQSPVDPVSLDSSVQPATFTQ